MIEFIYKALHIMFYTLVTFVAGQITTGYTRFISYEIFYLQFHLTVQRHARPTQKEKEHANSMHKELLYQEAMSFL